MMPNLMPESLGPCPPCGGNIESNEGAWACEDCGLRLPWPVVSTCWMQFLLVRLTLEQIEPARLEEGVIPGLRRCCICGKGFVRGQSSDGRELRFCYGCGFALLAEAWEHRANLGAHVRAKVAEGLKVPMTTEATSQSLDKLRILLGKEFEKFL